MKKKVLMLSFVIILVIIVFWPSKAMAANNFSVTMQANNSNVEPGGEVLITVKLTNLSVGEEGINSYVSLLSYNTDVFESLTSSSVTGLNSWVPNYSPAKGKILAYKPTSLKNDEDIMQITLKTKSDVAAGTQGEVKLTGIIISNTNDEYPGRDVSTNITVGSGTTQEPVNTTPNVINITNTQPVNNTPVNVTPVNNTPVNNTPVNLPQNEPINVVNETETNMPHTGTDSEALIRIIIGFVFIGLVIYIKIERMNKDIR